MAKKLPEEAIAYYRRPICFCCLDADLEGWIFVGPFVTRDEPEIHGQVSGFESAGYKLVFV